MVVIMSQIISCIEAKSQGLKFYFTGKPCKRNHICFRTVSRGSCIECIKVINNKCYKNNRNKQLYKAKKYYDSNRDYKLKYAKDYRDKNPDKVSAAKRKYYDDNAEKVKNRSNEYKRINRKVNPDYMAIESMRAMVRRTLELTNETKNNRTSKILGYSCRDLRNHIESHFTKGMCWGNRSEWHIDHVIPISKMYKAGVTDPSIINGLWNLIPLWKQDNLRKSDKL